MAAQRRRPFSRSTLFYKVVFLALWSGSFGLGTLLLLVGSSAAPIMGRAYVGDAAPRTNPADATIIIASIQTARGVPVVFDVRLETTVQVDGWYNEIVFGPQITLATDERGDPDCMVNPAIHKTATSFRLECEAIGVCRLRVVGLTGGPVNPIPTGSTLYSCRIVITATAKNNFSYPLDCQAPVAADPNGTELATACVDGSVTVSDLPPTFTSPTPTAHEAPLTPSATAALTSTGTPPVSPTPTNSALPRPNDDGCQVVAPAPRPLAWLLIVAPVLFAVTVCVVNR